jgi:hypothetical protein
MRAIAVLLGLSLLLTADKSAAAQVKQEASASAGAQNTELPKYTGPGSCASPSCHGAVQARAETSVQQNEYSTWVVKDKHARAFSNLSGDVAKRMTRLMGLLSPDKEPRCLGCHALNAPEEQRARTFDASDGVSCESCHGPASNWLGPHTTRGWTHEKSVALGMQDLRDPANRAENCLTCHLGTKDKSVDHELIASGHPDLYFELASFTAAMPKHWKETVEKPNATPDPGFEVRMLAVGQAVQLRDQLQRVSRNAQGGVWPEFSDLDCFACHHSLTNAENSWQQQRGYSFSPGTARRPGNPPWNLARYVVLRQVVNEVDPDSGRQLEAEMSRLYSLVSSLNADRTQVAALANSTSSLAGQLVPKLSSASYDASRTLRTLKAIVNDADYISRQGERPAEQSVMAVQSLYTAYSATAKPANDAEIRQAISGLFQQLENPSAYNAFKFADQLKGLARLLP